MTTATKTKKQPEAVPTFEELAAQKMRQTIEAYRAAVEREASGERLLGEDLEKVESMLAAMHLPGICWARDVQAQRNYRTAAAAASAGDAARASERAEAEDLLKQIKQLEEQIAKAKGRFHECTSIAEMRYVNSCQRQAELETVHPHLLAPIEQAVAQRLAHKSKALGGPGEQPREGWST
jgi:hypothetical protein